MALLKRTVTPKRLEANRRSAQHSTGPRTVAGKARSALNALRKGHDSKTMNLFYYILDVAPPGGVWRMARRVMTPAQLAHPEVAYMLDLYRSPADVETNEN